MKIKTYMDDYDKKYVRAAAIPALFGISRRTVNRLMDKIQVVPGYQGTVVHLSPTMTLVNLKKFEQFILSMDGAYLKEVK